MTIIRTNKPWQECEHQPTGWCLDCVKRLWGKKEDLREALNEIYNLSCESSYAAPELCGDPDRWEKLVDRIADVAHNALK